MGEFTKEDFLIQLEKNAYTSLANARRAAGRLQLSMAEKSRIRLTVDQHFEKPREVPLEDVPDAVKEPSDTPGPKKLRKRILAMKEATKVSWTAFAEDLQVPRDTLRAFIAGGTSMSSTLQRLQAGVARLDQKAGELVADGTVKKRVRTEPVPIIRKLKSSPSSKNLPSKVELLTRELELTQLLRKELYS